MVHNLLVMRHGKAFDINPGQDDFSRKLSQCGLDDTKIVAQSLRAQGVKFDCILCSSALRTRQTFASMLEFFSHDFNVFFSESFYYYPDEDDYISFIQKYWKYNTLLIIGHNPMVVNTVLRLSSTMSEIAIDISQNFSTSACANITFDASLNKTMIKNKALLVNFLTPNNANNSLDTIF